MRRKLRKTRKKRKFRKTRHLRKKTKYKRKYRRKNKRKTRRGGVKKGKKGKNRERSNSDTSHPDAAGVPASLAGDAGGPSSAAAKVRVPALLAASREGNLKIVKELVTREDIDVNIQLGYFRETPLYLASERGKLDIVKELLKHKDIDVNLQDRNNHTPLYYASYEGYTNIARELLKHRDIDVNLQNIYNQTPLYIASVCGNLDIVRMLLDAGADINIKNNEDKTALDIAIERRQRHVAELIKNEQNRRNEFEESLKSKTLEELRALVETQVVWDRNIILQFIRQRRVLQRHSRRRRRRSYAPGGEGAQRAQKSFYDAANP
jgi:hypothetical protein